jgi:hypothetical protein
VRRQGRDDVINKLDKKFPKVVDVPRVERHCPKHKERVIGTSRPHITWAPRERGRASARQHGDAAVGVGDVTPTSTSGLP